MMFEVPQGSSQFYLAYFYEIMHEGFPNEYAMLWCNIVNDQGHNYAPQYSANYDNNPFIVP